MRRPPFGSGRLVAMGELRVRGCKNQEVAGASTRRGMGKMDIVKTLDDAVPFLSSYPTWVKALVGVSILMIATSVIALLFSPKTVPVEKWLLASDEATIKALVPGEMFQEWETKKQTEDDLTRQLQKLADQQLGVGELPPSASADPTSLRLKVQKASNERNAMEVGIEEYISRELLAKGKLIARGIPNEAPPHDNEQIIIKPGQWQYLRLSISSRVGGFGNRQAGDAVDSKGATVFKGVEIGRPKGQD
jgi:hypothetical protein